MNLVGSSPPSDVESVENLQRSLLDSDRFSALHFPITPNDVPFSCIYLGALGRLQSGTGPNPDGALKGSFRFFYFHFCALQRVSNKYRVRVRERVRRVLLTPTIPQFVSFYLFTKEVCVYFASIITPTLSDPKFVPCSIRVLCIRDIAGVTS